MSKIKVFLWLCSGAFLPLLRRSPSESNKYLGIGAAVLFTGILAALSAGYALYTIFETVWISALFALLWGLVIFNLDRFIVSSMRKRDGIWTEWKLAVPRLVLGVLLALVISKPLELKIFEREINRKLDEGKALAIIETKALLDQGFPELVKLDQAISILREEIKQKEAFRNQKQREYDDERFGNKTAGTTGLRGLGINAQKKEEQLDEAQRDYVETSNRNQARIDELEAQRKDLMALRQQEFEKQQPAIDRYDGMAAKMEALSQLTQESRAMAMANLFIVLLFVAIETAPIFVKLLAEKGPYDHFLERHEEELLFYKEEMIIKSRETSRGRLKHFLAVQNQATDLAIENDLHLNRLKAQRGKEVGEAKIDFESKEALRDWQA